MIVSLIPREAMGEAWPIAVKFIEMSLVEAPGFYRTVDVLHNILNEEETLWGIFNDDDEMIAAVTTMIQEYPLQRRLLIHHCGGAAMEEWHEDIFTTFASYAKDTGCSGMDGRGRDGWIRSAKHNGLRKTASVYSIDFNQEV